MLTESIIRLKIAFSHLSMNGLFFWEALLFFNDADYKKIVEENFITETNSFPATEQKAIVYYKGIFEDLKKTRKDILENTEIRADVKKIREALIANAAHEMLVEEMENNLKNSQGIL